MAHYQECDMCGKRFPMGQQLNVVSFFERNRTPLKIECEERYGIEFKVRHFSPLKDANPRLELCDECFTMLKDHVKGRAITSDMEVRQ